MVKVFLNKEQSMEICVLGYTTIKGRNLFKKSRHDNILQAERNIQQGDIVAENATTVFILNPNNS